MLKRTFSMLFACFLRASGALWWARRRLRLSGAIAVLTFHRVLPDQDFEGTDSLAGMVVRERTFQKLAAYLSCRFEPVGLLDAEPGGANRKLRAMVTFDDGWKDTMSVALPIAHAHGIPIAVFLCPGLLDRAAPFWPENAANALKREQPGISAARVEALIETLKARSRADRDRLLRDLFPFPTIPYPADRTLTWEDVLRMKKMGVTIGSHTMNHEILPALCARAARREVRESKEVIAKLLNQTCEVFAYPNGDCGGGVDAIVAEEGYRLAFSTQCGPWMPDSDRRRIPRANVSEDNVTFFGKFFSGARFEYTTIWRMYRTMERARCADRELPERQVEAAAAGRSL
ncbi:MAG TPA: polysaccharide deacetylase family protein [Bryobacteraceae bacterium]|nr:polysaccharide deacetylase family protein [Bryobacteraceae bacterium]